MVNVENVGVGSDDFLNKVRLNANIILMYTSEMLTV